MNQLNAIDALANRGLTRRSTLAGIATAAAALAAFPLSALAGETKAAEVEESAAAAKEAAQENVVALNEVVYPEPISSMDYEKMLEVVDANQLDPMFLTGLDSFANELTCIGIGMAEPNAEKPNECLSPVSLYLALALLAQGAGDESDTQRQLLGVLGAESREQLAEQCGRLFRTLWARTTPEGDEFASTMQVANSLWMRKGVEFEQSYLDVATSDFCAELFSVAEPNQEAGEAMGAWISKHTGATLEPQVQLDPSWIMTLINTVWFKDGWTSAFNENDTEKGTFHTAAGEVECDFMTLTKKSAQIVRGADYKLASLGLTTGARLTFLLPEEGVDVRSFFGRAAGIGKLFYGQGAEECKVTYVVPKVSFDATTQVKEVCELMGVRDVFGDAADLSAMTPEAAYVSSIEQGTHFAMNEMGVEASAYTMAMVATMALLPEELEEVELRLDRPFAFRLTSPEGLVLFTGIVGDPTKA